MTHVDTWDENGVNHSWNIPDDFEPDLTFQERLTKWRTEHPEYENFGDLDYARELFAKFMKNNSENL